MELRIDLKDHEEEKPPHRQEFITLDNEVCFGSFKYILSRRLGDCRRIEGQAWLSL